MKLIYKGKYTGTIEEFPGIKDVKNAVKYVEAETVLELFEILKKAQNILACILIFVVSFISSFYVSSFLILLLSLIVGYFISLIFLVPHELLHVICFKKRVYLFYSLKPLMMFVVGEDHMSKFQFIFMSLLPNIVLGVIPFIIFLFNPFLYIIGFVSIFNIIAGIGDYYNVYNTVRQVPKGAKIFMKGENTYWYISKS